MVAVAVDQAHDHHRAGPRRSLCVSLVDGAFLDSVVVVRKYRLPDGADDEVHLGGYRLRGRCAAGGWVFRELESGAAAERESQRASRLEPSSALAAMALDGRLGAVRRLVRCGTVGDLAACIRRNQLWHRRSVFGMDAGFYVFRLPALEIAHRAALTTALVTLVAVALIYLGMRGLDRLDQLQATPQTRRHLLGLAALLLVLFGAGYLLANYGLQYSQRGFTPGPGFTDVTVVRPLNFLLAIVSVVAAVVLVSSRRMEQLRWLGIIAVTWLIAVGLGAVVPQLVQQAIVEPNELQRSRNIANNIALTNGLRSRWRRFAKYRTR